MKVYKVVSVDNGNFYSACQNDCFPKEFKVEYKIGKVVKPKIRNTMLFAFTDLTEAKKFAGYLDESKVFEAETPSVTRNIMPQHITSIAVTRNWFREFWNKLAILRSMKKKIDRTGEHPQQSFYFNNSVCCPSIKLIKAV